MLLNRFNKLVLSRIINRNALTRYSTKALNQDDSDKTKSVKNDLDEDVFNRKVHFNSILEANKIFLGYRRMKVLDRLSKKYDREEKRKNQHVAPTSLLLSQLYGHSPEKKVETALETEEKSINLPFRHRIEVKEEVARLLERDDIEVVQETQKKDPRKWLQDYELYDEENEIESVYGTPDPNIPASNVACPGCGAALHCIEPSIPGYIPSELFKGKKKDQLKVRDLYKFVTAF